MTSFSLVIAAAGRGRRMGTVDKVLLPLAGRPLLSHNLDCFVQIDELNEVVIVGRETLLPAIQSLFNEYDLEGRVIAGGDTRIESVCRGLEALKQPKDLVAIHDVARPLVTPKMVRRVVSAAGDSGAAAPAVAVSDTIKRVKAEKDHIPGRRVDNTLARDQLRKVQTPQVFLHNLILEAHRSLERKDNDAVLTDDASLVEALGHTVRLVEGSQRNRKITTWQDLTIARSFIEQKCHQVMGNSSSVRVGVGYDLHRTGSEQPLILGGVKIHEATSGLIGQSDADAALHAIADALLGSCSLGDIGKHFPDDLPEYKDACSCDLLAQVAQMVREGNCHPVHVDLTIIAESPRLAPYVEKMCNNIADILDIPRDDVSVKATTNEGLGPVGEDSAIAALAVCTVLKK